MKKRKPSALSPIVGTYQRPSTLDVLCTINGMSIAARRAEYIFDGYEERQARAAQRVEDSDAIVEQIDWLCDSEEAATSAEDRARLSGLVDYLLSLQQEILAEQRRDEPKTPPLLTVQELLYVPVAYALSILRNVVLLALCWIALITVVIAILRAI